MTVPFSPRDRRSTLAGGVRVSSFCASNGCVGVAPIVDGVEVVDTKIGDSPVLRFTPEEWAAFVAGVKAGEFDISLRRAAPGARASNSAEAAVATSVVGGKAEQQPDNGYLLRTQPEPGEILPSSTDSQDS